MGLGAGLLGGGGGQDFARTVEGVDDVAVDIFLADAIKEAGADHEHKGLGGHAREHKGNATCGDVGIDFFQRVEGGGVQHKHVAHTQDEHAWAATVGEKGVFKFVRGAKEEGSIDFKDFHLFRYLNTRLAKVVWTGGMGRTCKEAGNIARFGGFAHTANEEEGGKEHTGLDGNCQVNEDSEEEAGGHHENVRAGALEHGFDEVEFAHVVGNDRTLTPVKGGVKTA